MTLNDLERRNSPYFAFFSTEFDRFSGRLYHSSFRRPGEQYKRYQDCLKSTMTQCGITPSELETLAMDRTGWRFTCKSAV